MLEGDLRGDMSAFNDVTNLNDVTGLERLSSGEVSASQPEGASQLLDKSQSQSGEGASAQMERLSAQQ